MASMRYFHYLSILLRVVSCFPVAANESAVLPAFTAPNDLYAQEFVDLTREYPLFDDSYTNIVIAKRNSLTADFLQDLHQKYGDFRVSVEDSETYVLYNKHKETEDAFAVTEFDFKHVTSQKNGQFTVPLTDELIQNMKDGTGSVSSSVSFTISGNVKHNRANGISTGLEISGATFMVPIPGLYVGFSIDYTVKQRPSITLSTSAEFSASCLAVNGHSVYQYLLVDTTQYSNIKVRNLVYHKLSNYWESKEWESTLETYDPILTVVCLARDQVDPESLREPIKFD